MTRRRILSRTFMLVLIAAVCVTGANAGDIATSIAQQEMAGTVPLSISMYESSGTYNTGDFSGDFTTDAWDITYLARHIAGIFGYEILHSGDISGDSAVDAWDITYLARAIAGVPGYNV